MAGAKIERGNEIMKISLLRNGSFDGDYYNHDGISELIVPDGWELGYNEDDDEHMYRPETKVIFEPYTDAFRILDGGRAWQAFKQYGRIDVWLYQQFEATGHVTFSAFAHAWYSTGDNVRVSEFNGTRIEDGDSVFTIAVGIDPDGGTNPDSPSVVWTRRHYYDEFNELGVECECKGIATAFIRASAQHPFKNTNVFIDAATCYIEVSDRGCRGAPRIQYDHTVMLCPVHFSRDEFIRAADLAYDRKRTLSFAPDDAGVGDFDSKTVELVRVRSDDWIDPEIRGFFDRWYPGTNVRYVDIAPEISPDHTYPIVETGSKLTLHAIGEGGTYDVFLRLKSSGYGLPYCKLLATHENQLPAVANLKQLSPSTKFIVRIMNVPGVSIEGPNFDGDPNAYMAAILPIMLNNPVVDYWELWNEQDLPGEQGHVKMANFAIQCMNVAHAAGVKLALMSYSTGVPEIGEWHAILSETDFFEKAAYGGHILSLHAYGTSVDPGSLKHHILRPTRLYEELLIPAGMVVPYIFTEYSVHETAPHVGITDWNIEDLVYEFAAIDDLLAQQPYCLGAALYTMGEGWHHYSLNEHWRLIADYILSVRNRENAT
jgi:hypothetical protein